MSWIPRARWPWVAVPCALACILVAFSSPAIAAPGAARPISENEYFDWALGDQVEPAAATLSSGSPFWTTITLIVWEDHRGPDVDIWGARIDSSDQLLDVGGFPICTAAGDQRLPDVTVRVGTYERDFLVVWEDWRTGNADIYATRVSNSGVVGDGGPSAGGFAISTGTGNQTRPAISNVYPSGFLNSQCLVVWEDDRIGVDQVRASRLSGVSVLDGPVDAGGLLVSLAASPAQTPDTKRLASLEVAGGVNAFMNTASTARGEWHFIRFGGRISTTGEILYFMANSQDGDGKYLDGGNGSAAARMENSAVDVTSRQFYFPRRNARSSPKLPGESGSVHNLRTIDQGTNQVLKAVINAAQDGYDVKMQSGSTNVAQIWFFQNVGRRFDK